MPVRKRRRALYTSKRQNWATPAALCALIARLWGGIALDPCAARHSRIRARARYFTGGLERPWPARGLVYVNPPYDEIAKWAARCLEHARAGGEVLMLVPARVDTRWFKLLRRAPGVAFVEGRLRFELPGARRESAPFPSAWVYSGRRSVAFEQLCEASRAYVVVCEPARPRAVRGTSVRVGRRVARAA
jgi:phage N-6-adenine-methyltransferase